MSTKPEAPAAGAAEKGLPLDFVSLGLRHAKGGGKLLLIATIRADGQLDEPRAFAASKRTPLVGHVYTGARFDDSHAYGLQTARYVRPWHDEGAVIDWTARERAMLAELAEKRLQADAAKIDAIERVMLPLRKQYAALQKRGDYAGGAALRAAVLQALAQHPRSFEL